MKAKTGRNGPVKMAEMVRLTTGMGHGTLG